MNLDFDKVLESVLGESAPSITIGGRPYPLRALSIADAALFTSVGAPKDGETEEAYAGRMNAELAKVFEGEPPPFLTKPPPPASEEAARRLYIAQINTLVMMISELIVEMVSLPKQLARAREATRLQIQEAAGSGSY